MSPQFENSALARVPSGRLTGRSDEIERLYLRAVSGTRPNLVRVAGVPGVGTSEILRHVYDRLFFEQRFVVPFYFSLRAADETTYAAATRFVYEFLLQAIAFRRNDPLLISSTPDICELEKLAPLSDADWVRSVCNACDDQGPLNDERAYIRSALVAPFRVSSKIRGRICMIIDDLHQGVAIKDFRTFIDQIVASSALSDSTVMLASRRNLRIPGAVGEVFNIEALPGEKASAMTGALARDRGVSLSDQIRDLLVEQLEGDQGSIDAVISGAHEAGRGLQTYSEAGQIYVNELVRGRIAEKFDQAFSRAAADADVQNNLISSLSTLSQQTDSTFSLNALRVRLGISPEEFQRLEASLIVDEIIDVSGGSATLTSGNVLRDYLAIRHEVTIGRVSEVSASANALVRFLKRAPRLMARDYRRRAALGLQILMRRFDLQTVPWAALDYRRFRDGYKGLSDSELRLQMLQDADTITLPQLSHVEPLEAHLPSFQANIEAERAIVGVGFTDRSYRDEDEVVWIGVEIDSKLEADHDVTTLWLDRIEAAARELDFKNVRVWLIAPEGFSAGAVEVISERNGIGSSRRQVELLQELLFGQVEDNDAKEYEMILPVGGDTELVAAHALEEIARRFEFPAKAINQIKTALVEAWINAAEHSLSPDQKIYQKFTVFPDRIIVTVSNRGIRLTDKINEQLPPEAATPESRRGWGLNLIRSLMDEVRIESVDDGTRIVMTKFLNN